MGSNIHLTSISPPLKVLWATKIGAENDWEVDYIQELLTRANITFQFETVRTMQHVVPGALIVINHSVSYLPYLQQYEDRNLPFGVIHLSDEWFDDDVSFYKFNMCQFAIRNYYYESFDTYPKLHFMPLGYKHGFWKDVTPVDRRMPIEKTHFQRPYVWSFAGAPRTDDRMDTLRKFMHVHPNYIHYEQGNSFETPTTGLSTESYRKLLCDTQFGLCPRGISKTTAGETYRVSETLECGGIPIVLTGANSKGESYWKSLFGKEPPFIMGETWYHCLLEVEECIQDPEACEARRVACCQFWQTYKSAFADKLGKLIRDHLLIRH